MIVSLAGFFWYSYTHFDKYTLPIASEHGVRVDSVFWITMAVTVAAFVLISIILLFLPTSTNTVKEERLAFSRITICSN